MLKTIDGKVPKSLISPWMIIYELYQKPWQSTHREHGITDNMRFPYIPPELLALFPDPIAHLYNLNITPKCIKSSGPKSDGAKGNPIDLINQMLVTAGIIQTTQLLRTEGNHSLTVDILGCESRCLSIVSSFCMNCSSSCKNIEI